MSIKAIIFSTLGVILGLLALTWVIQGNEFFLFTIFGRKMENARYNAFKESQPYRDGLVKDLHNLQSQYVQADSAHQSALGGVILSTLGDSDESKLPSDLQQFILKLRQDQLKPAKADQ
jgi:hypothetical protein